MFSSIFPKIENQFFAKTCYTISRWFSDNFTYIVAWKFISGICAFVLYYSMDTYNDYRIKIFKAFIAFIFSEIYLLYSTYIHILKPHINKEKPIYSTD